MSACSTVRIRCALALLVVFGVLTRAVLPTAAIAAPATIEALTGTPICAHDADGAPIPHDGHHEHADDCCTVACVAHAALALAPMRTFLLATVRLAVLARPRPVSDARAPRPPPCASHAPRGPPALV